MAVLGGLKVPKKTVVSEATRERETFRYENSLFANITYIDAGVSIPENLVTGPDVILTALTRLAASQIGTAHSFISLFDQSYQYIVAEATPTIPLILSLEESALIKELWMCNVAIIREHGACENTLLADELGYLDPDDNLDDETLPVLVVDDLTVDPRFSSRPYCQPGGLAKFYAAVPIRTDRGVNIGVLCVMDTEAGKDRPPWVESHARLLRELSQAVTEHLETSSLKKTQKRTELMSRGLRAFVEGDVTVTGKQASSGKRGPRENQSHASMERQAPHKQQSIEESVEAMALKESKPSEVGSQDPAEKSNAHQSVPNGTSSNPKESGDVPRQLETSEEVFSKAAKIVKNAIETEGCLFLNADMLEFSGTSPSSADWADDELAARRPSTFSHTESENTHTISSTGERSKPTCQVLGSSASGVFDADESSSPPRVALPQALLARMIRRYPRGHVFNFDGNGDLQPDELDTDINSVPASPIVSHDPGAHGMPPWGYLPTKQERELQIQQKEAGLVLDAFPKARSVAFVPIWDPRKERWSAGGFIYTLLPNRTFTPDLDLSYLRALGMLAAAEAFRLETMAADKVKSDALGSLSHELRSPLHGAVLSVELLNDTDLSVPQQNIVHTIETCCRTLSDTIDHLLDFSKVNNLAWQEASKDSKTDGLGLSKVTSHGSGMKPPYQTVQLDILVEEVLESVYAGFNFQHLSITQHSNPLARPRSQHDTAPMRRLDSIQALEELNCHVTKKMDIQSSLGDVAIFLMVDPSCSWAFETHPGPMRRIVMNLFGNSLKYTHHGVIKVSLEQSIHLSGDNKKSWVTLTVSDSGIGMGDDFLQNSLFKPFSQENHLASGTGLGLSFVKQITSQLGGHISVNSRVGTGTTVTVSLPMTLADTCPTAASEGQENEEDFGTQLNKIRGLRVKVLDVSEDGVADTEPSGTTMEVPDVLLQNLCRDRLCMQPNSELESKQLVPDLVIWSEKGLEQSRDTQGPLSHVPGVVLCANALTAHQYATGTKSAPRPGIFEFICQPLGARKLAKAFSLALHRWTDAQTSSIPGPSAVTDKVESMFSLGGVPEPTPKPGHLFPLTFDATPSPSGDHVLAPEFLLVDDNPINLKILAAYMKKLKQPYQTATNGLEALTTYEVDPGRYICILMDISMPVMDGFEATRRIRSLEQRSGLRPSLILALTGLASEEAQREATVSGVDMFLTKPVRLKELGPILKLRGVLEDK
ncbi:hypothetical protein FZEAL_2087 [Fusarium zealandicum]|uniref:histidine kinase n=1 Tax=Fusarium zealandicum TaxID=1053134 RepID=A0A8H4XN22_9HYPO|nr:hypothetical protein FZEAL_2087 [Fusarium zealandicum]